jgi:hypothetical protein
MRTASIAFRTRSDLIRLCSARLEIRAAFVAPDDRQAMAGCAGWLSSEADSLLRCVGRNEMAMSGRRRIG